MKVNKKISKTLFLTFILSSLTFVLTGCFLVNLKFKGDLKYLKFYDLNKNELFLNYKNEIKYQKKSDLYFKLDYEKLISENKYANKVLINNKVIDNIIPGNFNKFSPKNKNEIQVTTQNKINAELNLSDPDNYLVFNEDLNNLYLGQTINLDLNKLAPSKKKIVLRLNGENLDFNQNFKIILKEQKTNLEVLLEDVYTDLTYEKEIEIDKNIIAVMPNYYNDNKFKTKDGSFKKVKARKLIAPYLPSNIIKFNLSNTKFSFLKAGTFSVYYQYIFDDNSKNIIEFKYHAKREYIYNDEISQTRYKHLENNYLKFIDKDVNYNNFSKKVGNLNSFYPDWKMQYYELSFNNDEIIKNKREILFSDLEFDFSDIKFFINNIETDKVGLDSNKALKFADSLLDQEFILKAKFKIKDEDIEFVEKIKYQSGINAYSDLELRKYVREIYTYDNIYIQRNIKAKETKQQVFNFEQNGEVVKSLVNNGLSGIRLKDEILDPFTIYNTGCLYYRTSYLDDKKIKNPKALNLDGNYYTIDCSDIPLIKEINEEYRVPDVTSAIFKFGNGLYNENLKHKISNLTVKGNGGIVGNADGVPVNAGSLHNFILRGSELTLDNVNSENGNDGIWSLGSKLTLQESKIYDNYGRNIYFSNTMGEKNISLENRKKEILHLIKSKIGNASGGGIQILDSERRERPEHIEINSSETEENNAQYSFDPTVILEDSKIECLVRSDSSLFKIFGLQKMIPDVIKIDKEYRNQINHTVLRERVKGVYEFNIAFLPCGPSYILKPTKNPNSKEYYYLHDNPRWDINYNGIRSYRKANYHYLDNDFIEFFKPAGALITFPEIDYLKNYYELLKDNLINEYREKNNPTVSELINLRKLDHNEIIKKIKINSDNLNKIKTDSLSKSFLNSSIRGLSNASGNKKFLEIHPYGEFYLYDSFTTKGRVNGGVILGIWGIS